MESGRVKVDQQKKQYDFQIKGAKLFATCNEINRLSKPLQSRFRKLFLPRYTNDNYRDFYLGLDQGGDAYDLVDGAHYLLYNGPPGHTAEYYAGWKFGYGLGLAFDSDCGGVAVVK